MGYRCEACGNERDNVAGVYLEAHERWAFLAGNVQVLKRLICLCTPCHEVTHFGYATVRGRDAEALRHLMHVNNWHRHIAQGHVDDAFRLWRVQSVSDWELDITMLTAVGISVIKPLTPAERRSAVTAMLDSQNASGSPEIPVPAPQKPTPAGWYGDPGGEHRWRWWDGHSWTRHVG
jgi:hypothetical protein